MNRREFLLVLGGLLVSRHALGQDPVDMGEEAPPSDPEDGNGVEAEPGHSSERGTDAGSAAAPSQTRILGSEAMAQDDAFFPAMVGGWPR